MNSYRLQIIYIETNLESVFWVEGKKNEKIIVMWLCLKKIELYCFWFISEEKENSEEYEF